MFRVHLGKEDADRCVLSTSPSAWKVGDFLSVNHDDLFRKTSDWYGNLKKRKHLGMLITWISVHDGTCEVQLKAANNSTNHFKFLFKEHSMMRLTGCKIGPSDHCFGLDQHISTYMTKFDEFFGRNIFGMVTGRIAPSNGDVRPSSTLSEEAAALETIMGTQGFVCLQGPPGSGKTRLAAEIVKKKFEKRDSAEHLILTSMSNDAVNRVVQLADKNLTRIGAANQIMREHTMQSGEGISQEDDKLSLQYQTDRLAYKNRVDQHCDVVQLLSLKNMNEEKVRQLKSVEKGFASVDDGYDINRQLKKKTLAVANCYAIGSSVAMVIRHAHQYSPRARGPRLPKEMGGNAEKPFAVGYSNPSSQSQRLNREQSGVYEPEEEKFFDKVTDVIIDEASQLSTCWALPLYMTSPEVKNVILMGDPHQLEPFCRFKEDTFLYQIASQSELSRIVDILYKPIYGDEVMAAAPKEKHNLASDRNIEVADKPVDPAPVLFVDYGYVNTEKGVNEKEVEMVVKCVKVMTEVYKIPGKEIAIVCHNRKQLARMQQKFAKQGTIGTFKTSVHIHTVDSFIGGEARVVMVLISKTCQSWTDVERVMQSVSDPHRGIVAVSRASDAVYLFGQWKMLVQTEFWGKFVDKIVEERCLVDDGWRPARDHQYQYLVDAKAGKYLVEYEDIV